MKLSVIDRIIIIQSLLPEKGTIEQIKLTLSIKNKIGFLSEELEAFRIFEPYKGMLEIPDVTTEMLERNKEYDLTAQEIEILGVFAQSCNNNGWVTASSLDTIEMLINYKSE